MIDLWLLTPDIWNQMIESRNQFMSCDHKYPIIWRPSSLNEIGPVSFIPVLYMKRVNFMHRIWYRKFCHGGPKFRRCFFMSFFLLYSSCFTEGIGDPYKYSIQATFGRPVMVGQWSDIKWPFAGRPMMAWFSRGVRTPSPPSGSAHDNWKAEQLEPT